MDAGWQVSAGALGFTRLSLGLAASTAWLLPLFLPLQRQLTSLADRNVLVLVVWPGQQEKAPLNKSAAILKR